MISLKRVSIIFGTLLTCGFGNEPLCSNDEREGIVTCFASNANSLISSDFIHGAYKTVILSNCRIIDFETDAFRAVPTVEYLDLSLNDMHLPLGLFDYSHNLKELNLSRIILPDLRQVGSFHRSQSYLLSPSRIMNRTIHPELLRHCPKLEVVVFTGYDMSEVAHNTLQACRALKLLDLHRCSLNEVPMFATQPNLRTMNHLKLSSNAITTLDNPKIFDYLENLGILDLADNLIEDMQEEVFKPLKNLKRIQLGNNKIVQIAETLFQGMFDLGEIDLSHNMIQYVPVNAFKGTELKTLNLASNRFTNLDANFCSDLRKSGATLSNIYFNQNPWQCACLNEILVEAKRLDINYNKAIYKGEEPVCVTREFICKREPSLYTEFIYLYKIAIRRYTSGKSN